LPLLHAHLHAHPCLQCITTKPQTQIGETNLGRPIMGIQATRQHCTIEQGPLLNAVQLNGHETKPEGLATTPVSGECRTCLQSAGARGSRSLAEPLARIDTFCTLILSTKVNCAVIGAHSLGPPSILSDGIYRLIPRRSRMVWVQSVVQQKLFILKLPPGHQGQPCNAAANHACVGRGACDIREV
jgi:hypothetical protein